MPSKKTLNFFVLLSALVAIVLDLAGHDKLFALFKPLTTILIVTIPVLYGNTSAHKTYVYLTIIALLFCLFGDIFLLDDDKFVLGLASFLVAHILFLVSFITIDKFKFHLLPLLVLALYGIIFYLFLYDNLEVLALPVLLYVIFIILMAWQGISLYSWKKETAHQLIALGVLFFIASDSILALNKFKLPFSLAGPLILATYWLAIALLANATNHIEKP